MGIVKGSQWQAARESARRQSKVNRMASQNVRGKPEAALT